MAWPENSIRLFGTLWGLTYLTFLIKAYMSENFQCLEEKQSSVYCQKLEILNWLRTGYLCPYCVLTKILSKVLSNHMKTVISSVVHPNQT